MRCHNPRVCVPEYECTADAWMHMNCLHVHPSICMATYKHAYVEICASVCFSAHPFVCKHECYILACVHEYQGAWV